MDWKKVATKLLFPPPLFIWMLWPVALGLLIYSFIAHESADVISIVSYVLSFYALMLILLKVPDIIDIVQRFRKENTYVVRYTSDVRLRINLSLQMVFVFNVIYALFQLCLGLWHHSVWFYSMAGYYLLLAAIRLMLAKYTRIHTPGQKKEMEWKMYRLCGAFLLLITFALAIFIIYFVWKIRVFRHHEITTIAIAAYTFFSLVMAICNVIRYRNYGSPAYSAAKAIALVSAIVSVLTLENAMLTAFGQDSSELFRRIMLGTTGIAVICMVQGIAIYMIVNAGQKLKTIHNS